jgi:Tol biopolymer transport system component
MDVKLIKISVLSGESEIIGSFEHIAALSVSLSSTGEQIVFTKREQDKDNIYLTLTKNMATKKITNNVHSNTLFGSLTWFPDGKKVFFDKQEKINSISMIENFR